MKQIFVSEPAMSSRTKTVQCERKELVFLARKHFLADELANKFSFFIIGFDESERMRQFV